MMAYRPTAEGLLAPLTPWMEVGSVTEIMLNQPGEIFVEQCSSIQRCELPVLTERYLYQLFRLIANESSQLLSQQRPMLAANLYNQARIQCVIPPITRCPAFCIRLKSITTPSLSHYVLRDECINQCEHQSVVRNNEQLIQQVINRGSNIVVCGATGSGKTTFVNACLRLIDQGNRLITIEDTPELICQHENCLSLLTYADSNAGVNVNFQDLVKLSLRLRPDRIIIGEIRGDEVVDFIKACNTGHKGSMTSIHANSADDALLRLRQLYLSSDQSSGNIDAIDTEIRQAIDLVVYINKVCGRYYCEPYFVHCD